MTTVLILDDDPDLIDALAELLREECGYVVEERLERSLDDIDRVRPDILIIDCPPGADKTVLNFVQRVRIHPQSRALPVVITTSSLRFVEPTLLHAKRIHVLLKPFDVEELLETVRQLAPLDVARAPTPSAAKP